MPGHTAVNMPWEKVQVPVNLSVFLGPVLLQPAAISSTTTTAANPRARARTAPTPSRRLAGRLAAREGHLGDPFDEVTIKIASFFGRPGQVLAVGEIRVGVGFYHIDLVVMRQAHVDAAVVTQARGLVGAHGDLGQARAHLLAQILGDHVLDAAALAVLDAPLCLE